MSITDNCLTIGGINVCLTDKMNWDFQYNPQSSEGEESPVNDKAW